jgi:CRISPR-associated endonuclease Cas1
MNSDNTSEGTPISENQHPDFIWTWKSNDRSSKTSLWLPYFAQASKVPRKKLWTLSYNGGILEVDLSLVDLIMFYGATGDLPMEFLDEAAKHGIILIIHRRNVNNPYFFFPPYLNDPKDVLTRQILVRNHAQKRVYVAKVLIRERLQKMRSRIPIPETTFKRLAATQSIFDVRGIEAVTTARYWNAWFDALGVETHRRESHPLKAALDAGSKFLYGVLLRWIVFHKLSPNHGFLHEPTGYPSLAYDLMEPYRYLIEDTVFDVWSSAKEPLSEKDAVARTLARLKDVLDESCFVPATRQCVRKKNLLHGITLALRSYILGDMKKFVVPVEGFANGGRPPAVSYKLPGNIYNVDLRKFRITKETAEENEDKKEEEEKGGLDR